MFDEQFRKLIMPRAQELGIAGADAAALCSVTGDFETERSAIAYCMAYAWMHYASFKEAIRYLRIGADEVGNRPLVVDIGCGPATAGAAVGDWLYEQRRRRTEVCYVGIDRSSQMRDLAAAIVQDPIIFKPHRPVLLAELCDVRLPLLASIAPGRDSIVITLSYVLHQRFMSESEPLAAALRDLATLRMPIWIIAQDANLPFKDEPNVESWPETRLRTILNPCETNGYRIRCWSKRFEAVQYFIDEEGAALPQPARGRKGTNAIAARLNPA